MKEAHECLKHASQCDKLAEAAEHVDGQRMYLQLARQWRKLADDSPRHQRLVGRARYARAALFAREEERK
jgi:hypothetical protein